MRVEHDGARDRVRGSVCGIIVFSPSFTSHVSLLFPLAISSCHFSSPSPFSRPLVPSSPSRLPRPVSPRLLSQSHIVKAMGKHLDLQVMVCMGGTSVRDDIMRLFNTVHILVGTPARILDLARRDVAKLGGVVTCALDEADKVRKSHCNIVTFSE